MSNRIDSPLPIPSKIREAGKEKTSKSQSALATAKNAASATASTVENLITKYPTASLAAAVTAGLLLGWATKRK